MTSRPTSAPPRRRWLRASGARVLGGGLLLLALLALLVMIPVWPALGAKPSGERLARIQQSPQHRDGRFVNTLPTITSGMSFDAAREFFFGGSDYREPDAPLPVVPRAGAEFADAADFRVTWLGHSTLLVELDGARVLVDPVWGERASPMPFAGPKRFFDPLLPLDELPALDAVVISHDHYDHLDESTIRALADRVPRFYVPLGVGSHLEYWGVAPDRITEADWWDRFEVGNPETGGIALVSTPARHFSGRSLTDRNATLWSGWAFLGADRRIFYSGDTALAPEFAEIGERLGPFDLTFVESGAYNAAWADLHVGPEQAIAIHEMVRGDVFVPVHWGMFDLSLHGWTEPAERVRAAAEAAGVRVAFPRPGESITLGDVPTATWWPEIPWATAAESPVVSSGLPEGLPVPTP